MTSRFTTNKWVGLDVGGGSQYLNTQMYDYLEKNKWGLWLEGPYPTNWWQPSGGVNNQSAVIATIQSKLEPYLSVIQNNYTIPIRMDAKGYSNNAKNDVTWNANNFGQVFAYYENWTNGTKGDCLQQYWFEGMQDTPAILQYMRQATSPPNTTAPRTFVWGMMATWNWPNLTQQQRLTLFSYPDIVDIEVWWTNDTARTIPMIQWILTNQPNKKIGIDTQLSGSWPDAFHLWGSDWDVNETEPTYAVQRTRCTTAINAIKTAFGRQFDSLTAEVAGDSGDITQTAHTAANGTVYPQGGWTTVQIMTEQLDYFDALKWEKTGGGNTTTYLASTSNSVSVAVSDAAVATQLTAVAPTNATTSVAFTISGVLSAAGTGIANQTVQLQKGGVSVSGKTATTNASGAYSISVTEATAGTYSYQTVYAGGTV